MTIRCPTCGATVRVTGQPAAGPMRVRCPKCLRSISVRVPGTAPAAPTPPASAPSRDEMFFDAPEAPGARDPGDLGAAPLPQALADLWKRKQTGRLEIGGPDRSLALRQGDIVSFRTTDPRFGLLRLLRDARKIAAEVHDAWAPRAASLPPEDLAAELQAASVIDAAKASAALGKGCEMLVFMLAAETHHLRFSEGPSGPRELKVVMEKLVLDALRHAVPEDAVRRGLPAEDRALRFVASAMGLFQSLPLTEEEQRLLTLVDGRKSLGELLSSGVASPASTLRSIYALLAFGVLEAADTVQAAPSARTPATATPAPHRTGAIPRPPTPDGFGFVLESEERAIASSSPGEDVIVEAVLDDGTAPPAELPGAEATSAPAAGETPPAAETGAGTTAPWIDLPASDDVAAVVAEIERLIPESEGKNHFELLHVERASDLKAIKKSYFAFARRYHPDKFFSVGSEDTRRRIDALYTRLTVAFETLKDGKRREEYEASLDAPPAERAERQGDVIRAEIQFGEAQVALQQRDFAKAKDAVAWSLRLNPEKGKYHALLGRILTESKEYDAAVAAFEKAAELEPKQALHRFLAGRALLQKGSTAEAKRLFQIAIAVDPGCHEAKRELRLLEMRGGAGPATQARPGVSKSERAEHDEKKKGGLFGKLLGKG